MNENRICGMDIVLMLRKLKLRKVHDEGVVDAIIESIRTIYTLKKKKESEGYRVGKLFVTSEQISSYQNRQIFRGEFGQPVFVKKQASELTNLEMEYMWLVEKDDHCVPILQTIDIGEESFVVMKNFVCSLSDLVKLKSPPTGKGALRELLKFLPHDLQLWDKNDLPTAHLLGIMWDIVEEIHRRHSVGLGHHYLTPEHVFINSRADADTTRISSPLCAKLIEYYNCFDVNTDAFGLYDDVDDSEDITWKSPEEVNGQSVTLSSDMFKLGLIFNYLLTKGGHHPYIECKDDDIEVIRVRFKFEPTLHEVVQKNPEANHLLGCLLKFEPDERVDIRRLQLHPMFWNSDKRLLFICRVSDKIVASGSEETTKNLLLKFGMFRFEIFGDKDSWEARIDKKITNANTYDKRSLFSLLRLIRNMAHHHLEDPHTVKEFIKQQNGIEPYFRSCFPTMVMRLYYAVIVCYGVEQEDFAEFFT